MNKHEETKKQLQKEQEEYKNNIDGAKAAIKLLIEKKTGLALKLEDSWKGLNEKTQKLKELTRTKAQ